MASTLKTPPNLYGQYIFAEGLAGAQRLHPAMTVVISYFRQKREREKERERERKREKERREVEREGGRERGGIGFYISYATSIYYRTLFYRWTPQLCKMPLVAQPRDVTAPACRGQGRPFLRCICLQTQGRQHNAVSADQFREHMAIKIGKGGLKDIKLSSTQEAEWLILSPYLHLFLIRLTISTLQICQAVPPRRRTRKKV